MTVSSPGEGFQRSRLSLSNLPPADLIVPPSVTRLMKKLTPLILLFLLASISSAQSRAEHALPRMEAGLFLDSLSISQTGTNNLGLGLRFGYRMHNNILLEGELAYDYGLNFDEAYRDISTGNIVAIEHTSVGATQALFGPAFKRSGGHLHPFATLKAGFIDFRLSPGLLPYSSIVSTVFGLRTSNWNAALYPAAGVEATLGPVGLRLEAGDELYFNRGAHNNLRITFGPMIRF